MNPADFDLWMVKRPRQVLLMGVLNATPDSFSDGGSFLDQAAAIRHGLQMLADGASIIDVGGESTRPGSASVEPAEQIRRAVPVIERLAKTGAVVSIDTTSAAVAKAAIEAGATIINDISAGLFDADMLTLAATSGAAIVLMHMQGTPRTMQAEPAYVDVVAEVQGFLKTRARAAIEAGVDARRILIDVGIGFGKSLRHNLELLHDHGKFASLGYPVVLGTSRKSFIGEITKQPVPSERLMGTAATCAWGMTNGTGILRVHDVKAMREVVDMIDAIRSVETTQSSRNS